MWKRLPSNMTFTKFIEFLDGLPFNGVTVFTVAAEGSASWVHSPGISMSYDRAFFDRLVSMRQTIYYYHGDIALPKREAKTFLGKTFVPATPELVRGDFYTLENGVVVRVKVVYDEFLDGVDSFYYGKLTATELAEKLNEEGILVYREGY